MRQAFMVSSNNEWDQIYRKYPLEEMGWELTAVAPEAKSIAGRRGPAEESGYA